MKKLILIAAVALFGFAASAQLVTIGPSTGSGAPGNLAASSTKTYIGSGTNIAIDVRGQKDVAIEVSHACLGAGTDAVTFVWRTSIDGTNMVGGVQPYQIFSAGAGTATVRTMTNFSVAGYPYLRLAYVTNGVAQVLTNVTVRYWYKNEFDR